jgi:hypothetical protein
MTLHDRDAWPCSPVSIRGLAGAEQAWLLSDKSVHRTLMARAKYLQILENVVFISQNCHQYVYQRETQLQST